MRKLSMFMNVSLDGFFTDRNSDMSWAHAQDPEWVEFTSANAKGGGMLLFGRKTYEEMVRFWPTPMAAQVMPAVAERMNSLPKIVFSRTLETPTWNNTRALKGDPVAEVRTLKTQTGEDMAIMGSGTIVSQLTDADLIDEYQIAVVPIILGVGRTPFEGVTRRPRLARTHSRAFGNGNVFMRYEPVATRA